jgi:hypothetical protein
MRVRVQRVLLKRIALNQRRYLKVNVLALATLAAATAPKQRVSGEMLLTVFGVVFVVAAFLIAQYAKSRGSKSPVKLGFGLGLVAAINAVLVVIAVIAAHRM